VLLDLSWLLIGEYGDTPASVMLIDRAVAAYQDFVQITEWTGNTALMAERRGRGSSRPRRRAIRGLTVEGYINRLGQDMIPLAERCARVMREVLAHLEALRAVRSNVVERSKPVSLDEMVGSSIWLPPRRRLRLRGFTTSHRSSGCVRGGCANVQNLRRAMRAPEREHANERPTLADERRRCRGAVEERRDLTP
jgi:hypothetical protein